MVDGFTVALLPLDVLHRHPRERLRSLTPSTTLGGLEPKRGRHALHSAAAPTSTTTSYLRSTIRHPILLQAAARPQETPGRPLLLKIGRRCRELRRFSASPGHRDLVLSILLLLLQRAW